MPAVIPSSVRDCTTAVLRPLLYSWKISLFTLNIKTLKGAGDEIQTTAQDGGGGV